MLHVEEWRRRGGKLEAAEFDYAKAMELDAGNEEFAFNHVDILILAQEEKTKPIVDLKKLLDVRLSAKGAAEVLYARSEKEEKVVIFRVIRKEF